MICSIFETLPNRALRWPFLDARWMTSCGICSIWGCLKNVPRSAFYSAEILRQEFKGLEGNFDFDFQILFIGQPAISYFSFCSWWIIFIGCHWWTWPPRRYNWLDLFIAVAIWWICWIRCSTKSFRNNFAGTHRVHFLCHPLSDYSWRRLIKNKCKNAFIMGRFKSKFWGEDAWNVKVTISWNFMVFEPIKG